MVIFGIEGISKYNNRKKNYKDDSPIITDAVYACLNALAEKLLHSKPKPDIKRFFQPEEWCEELDLRDMGDQIGQDFRFAENVEIFFIFTHGTNDGTNAILSYDSKKNEWDGNSSLWKLGNSNLLKWLVLISCSTVNLKNPLGFWHVFENLHQLCGFYELIAVGAINGEDMGIELGQKLTNGVTTVADAWLDGTTESDSVTAAVVISAETQKTWNNAKPIWNDTTMNLDHMTGHGFTSPNVSPQDKHWLGVKWVEWYVNKRIKKNTGTVQLPPKFIYLGEIKLFSEPTKRKKRRRIHPWEQAR